MAKLAFVVLLALVLEITSTPIQVRTQAKKDHNDYTKNPHRVVCYFGSWAHYHKTDKFEIENIEYDLCTHINYGFAKINETTYEIQVFDPWLDEHFQAYQRFIDLKIKNPNLTTMISLGGWYEGSEKYSDMAKQPNRARFVDSVMVFLKKYKFDGLDIDWEHPANRGGDMTKDKDNYIAMLTELRAAFQAEGYVLTAALPAGKSVIDNGFDVKKLNDLLDWGNLMTYDYHGGWENILGHNAPLYSRPDETEELEKKLGTTFRLFTVNYTVNYYLDLGFSKDKMVMGVPFYGRSWTLMNVATHGLHDEAKGMSQPGFISGEAGVLGYNELCQMEIHDRTKWHNTYDPDYRAPYAWNDEIFIGFEDIDSISCKIAFLKSMGLSGGMVWALENDDFMAKCGGGQKSPLMNKVHRMLNGDEIKSYECKYVHPVTPTLPPTTPTTQAPTTTTTQTPPPTTTQTPSTASPTTQTPIDTTTRGVDWWCSRDGYMPHPSNPHEYFQCEFIPGQGWYIHLQHCPGQTIWVQAHKRCDG